MKRTIREILRKTAGVDSLDAQLLFAHVLKKKREHLLAHDNDDVTKFQETRYTWLVWKRKHGYPLAYLTGHKEFFGLDFLVNKHTLVPRPETEVMVESVLQKIEKIQNQKSVLIDVGTGSGCIPISVVTKSKQPIEAYAIDISRSALRVAKKNAKKHGANISFHHGNLLKPILEKLKKETTPIIITANLPYLSKEDYNIATTTHREPKSALVADDDGMALYKKLIDQVATLISPVSLFLEIDPRQATPLSSYAKTKLSSVQIEVLKDLAGNERIVIFDFYPHPQLAGGKNA